MSIVCSVCQNPLKANESSATKCGHVFHHTCITKWLNLSERGGCPECRSTICLSKDIFRLYLNVDEENENENSDNIEDKMKIIENMFSNFNNNLTEYRKKVRIKNGQIKKKLIKIFFRMKISLSKILFFRNVTLHWNPN